ncbi:MAG: hypothetical protein U0529_02525 [Thermoanaerobaculia bacterium]
MTRPGLPGGVRWTPTSGRPPLALLLLVLLLLLLAVFAGPAAGATVSGYREEIRLAADGSAQVRLVVDVAGAPGEEVRLPFGHAKADLATLKAAGATARIETIDGGLPVLVATLQSGKGPVEVTVSVPGFLDWKKEKAFRNRTFSHELVNATTLSCGRYEGTYLLPPGYRMNTIVETVPEDGETSATRPYEVVRVDGRDGLRLTEPSLDPARRVSAKVRFKPGAHLPFFPPLLLAVAAGWLWLFRDLAGGPK